MAGKKFHQMTRASKKVLEKEQDKLCASFCRVKPDQKEVSQEFRKIASEVFSKNDELFRKLAL